MCAGGSQVSHWNTGRPDDGVVSKFAIVFEDVNASPLFIGRRGGIAEWQIDRWILPDEPKAATTRIVAWCELPPWEMW